MADQKREEDVEKLNPDQQPEDDVEELIIDHPNKNPKVTDRDREVANKISELIAKATDKVKRKLEAEGPGPSGEPKVKSVGEKKAEVSGESSAASKAIVAIRTISTESFGLVRDAFMQFFKTPLATILAAQNLAEPIEAFVLPNEDAKGAIEEIIQALMFLRANSSTTGAPSSEAEIRKELLDNYWRDMVPYVAAGATFALFVCGCIAYKIMKRNERDLRQIAAGEIFKEEIEAEIIELPEIVLIAPTSSESSDKGSAEFTTGQTGLLQIQALVMDHLQIPGQYRPRSRSLHTPAGSSEAKKLKPSPSAPGELNDMAGPSSGQRSSSPRTLAAQYRPQSPFISPARAGARRQRRLYIDLTKSKSVTADVHNVLVKPYRDAAAAFEKEYGVKIMERSHSHYL